MGIDPVQIVSSVIQNLSSQLRSSSPDLQRSSKLESSPSTGTQASSPIAQTEVKVHPDNSTGAQVLIYEFRNSKSGSLVYQIPSEQILGLMRTIQQQLHRLTSQG